MTLEGRIEALRAKTVENGCTPGESASAAAKADELEERLKNGDETSAEEEDETDTTLLWLRAGNNDTFTAEQALRELRTDDDRTWRATRLPLHRIQRLQNIFQVRGPSYAEGNLIERHVETLKRQLSGGKDLEPVVVWSCGGRWVLVDGHHRFAAYFRAGRKDIPVEVLDTDDVREAVRRSCRDNARPKEGMDATQRLDLAWRFVRDFPAGKGGYTKGEIQQLASVGEGTVASMRRVKRAMEAGETAPASYRTWAHARRWDQQFEPFDDDKREKYVEEQAEKLADRIAKAVGNQPLTGDLEIVQRALETWSGRRWREIVTMSAQANGWALSLGDGDEFEDVDADPDADF